MKNSVLYGAIIVLVLAVIALGYNNYARENAGLTDTTTVAPETTLETAGTDEEAAPAPDVTTDAAVDAAIVAAEDGVLVDGTTPAETTAVETAPADVTPDTTEEVAPAPEATDATTMDDQSLLAPPASLQMNVADMMADRVLGDINAPVTIVEYASYTCSHCAAFANDVLPQVKAQLIDTGKAKLILREFPLDKFALKASQMARCAPAERYHDLAEVIFRNQERWVKAEDPIRALKQLGSLTGMDEETMDACMNNVELENAILARVTEAQARYKVASTPTFVFNDGAETFAGSQTPERFVETVNKLSQ